MVVTSQKLNGIVDQNSEKILMTDRLDVSQKINKISSHDGDQHLNSINLMNLSDKNYSIHQANHQSKDLKIDLNLEPYNFDDKEEDNRKESIANPKPVFEVIENDYSEIKSKKPYIAHQFLAKINQIAESPNMPKANSQNSYSDTLNTQKNDQINLFNKKSQVLFGEQKDDDSYMLKYENCDESNTDSNRESTIHMIPSQLQMDLFENYDKNINLNIGRSSLTFGIGQSTFQPSFKSNSNSQSVIPSNFNFKDYAYQEVLNDVRVNNINQNNDRKHVIEFEREKCKFLDLKENDKPHGNIGNCQELNKLQKLGQLTPVQPKKQKKPSFDNLEKFKLMTNQKNKVTESNSSNENTYLRRNYEVYIGVQNRHEADKYAKENKY